MTDAAIRRRRARPDRRRRAGRDGEPCRPLHRGRVRRSCGAVVRRVTSRSRATGTRADAIAAFVAPDARRWRTSDSRADSGSCDPGSQADANDPAARPSTTAVPRAAICTSEAASSSLTPSERTPVAPAWRASATARGSSGSTMTMIAMCGASSAETADGVGCRSGRGAGDDDDVEARGAVGGERLEHRGHLGHLDERAQLDAVGGGVGGGVRHGVRHGLVGGVRHGVCHGVEEARRCVTQAIVHQQDLAQCRRRIHGGDSSG